MNDKVTVAVVDDNKEDRLQVLGAAQQVEAVEVKEYIDEDQFLDGIGEKSGSSLPSIVFLDLRMNSTTAGLEVLTALRSSAATKSMPVVMISSSDSVNDVVAAYKSGANVYVHKSDEPGEFSGVIQKLMEVWTTSGKLPG